MSKASIEQQALLEPETFDLDDLESANPSSENGYPNSDEYARRPSSGGRKTLSSAPGWLRRRWIIVAAVIVGFLLLGIWLNRGKGFKVPKIHNAPPPPPPPEEGGPPPVGQPGGKGAMKQWKKPEEFKIIGLIFFGRPSVVAILDCYLKKNLVTSGGWLDEVHFVVNTDKEDDIKYLDELVKTSELYKKIIIPSLGYNEVWGNAVEREHMYIKIDDDIVSISSLLSETTLSNALGTPPAGVRVLPFSDLTTLVIQARASFGADTMPTGLLQ